MGTLEGLVAMMKLGTKSVLFGVHQFLWHPITVTLAWYQIEGRLPKWWEACAIFFHDWGYWGCTDMDGESGRKHPLKGAEITANVVQALYTTAVRLRHPLRIRMDEGFAFEAFVYTNVLRAKAYKLALGHSRFYAEQANIPLSRLFRADKLSLRFDPDWFYLLRATATGEIWEYIRRSPLGASTDRKVWLAWYRNTVERKYGGRC